MAIWVDQNQEEQFNGVLVVMNPTGMGDLSYEERDVVSQAVKKALAGGLAVIRVYDKGVEPPPDWLDEVEGHCFGRASSWMGCKKARRMTKEMKQAILDQMPNSEDAVEYVGLCESGDGVEFVPPTKV